MSIKMDHIPDFESIDINDVVAGVLRSIAPDVVSTIQSTWPVATGKSRAGMESNVSDDKDSVSLNITNAVDYVPFVHSKGDKTLSKKKADDDLQSNADQINQKIIQAILDSLNNAKDKS